jgi:hypothetical protein
LALLILGTVGLGVGYGRADSAATAFAAAAACPSPGQAADGYIGHVRVDVLDAGETVQAELHSTSQAYWLEISGDGVLAQQVYLSCDDAASFLVAGELVQVGSYIPAQANAFAYENAPICTRSAKSGCLRSVQPVVSAERPDLACSAAGAVKARTVGISACLGTGPGHLRADVPARSAQEAA